MSRWDELKPRIRQLLGDEEYETWVEPLLVGHESASGLILESRNRIVVEWVRDHILRDIRTVARALFGHSFSVDLRVREDGEEQPEARLFESSPGLNEAFTFERFVVGPCNAFAAAAAEAVADKPGQSYNPLFIYGDAGLGKTHLLHAIAHRVKERSPELKVLYMTTEQFVNELINCIRRKKMDEFRATFRSLGVLLLDDVQFISGKERTQEEFFHTFNTLQSAGRQVVFTSDRKPGDLPGLEERLRSRFIQGLVADLQPPDLETRCAILRDKARVLGWDISEDAVMFIAKRVHKNIRELEGCLNRCIAYAQLTSRPLNLELAKMALSDFFPRTKKVTAKEIVRFVAHHYGVRVADLKGKSNRRAVSLPRKVAMYLMRELLGSPYQEIGKFFGKHHSTVIYAIESVEEMRRNNPDFDSTIEAFIEQLD